MATAKTLSPQVVAQPVAPASPPAPKAAPSVTPEQMAIVKATAPVLREQGVEITTVFYKNMIDENPELKNVFSLSSQATGAQPRALAAAVLSYATFIDDLPRLQHAVERIAHKHASLQIQPAQYDIVGKYLIEAIGLVLGEVATPPIVDAWTAAYGVLASVFIGREHTLYDEARTRDNNKGWAGWRKFRVQRREYAAAPGDKDHKEGILSLYLAPSDGKPLPTFEPGQYVSLQVFIPEFGVYQSRQYSLSQAPRAEGDVYRISVKRDNGNNGLTEPGRISNLLHNEIKEGDEIELSQPQGEFVVEENPLPTAENAEKPTADSPVDLAPLVLLSAGVGATPNMAILETAAPQGRTISWLHGSHSRAVLPFSKEVQAIRAAHPNRIQTHTVLTQAEADAAGAAGTTPDDMIVTGSHLKIADMAEADRKRLLFLDDKRTGYYICGPSSFMAESRDSLQALGVAPERIHLELFATGDM